MYKNQAITLSLFLGFLLSLISPLSAQEPLKGTVKETMNSGGYTYVLLNTGSEEKWVAIPEASVEVGQEVELQPGMTMKDFSSNALKRTFDKIIFSGGFIGQKNAYMGESQKATVAVKEMEKLEKAEGENGITVEEAFLNSQSLNEKTVRVRGKVVKVIPKIMGKNWIHLQDGTGTKQDKTNDLVFTTQKLPKTGDVITIEGKFFSDKDFGSGYIYKAIVEEAHIIEK